MRQNHFLLLAFITLVLTSCSEPRYIYSPAPPLAAHLKEKGDSKVSGYFSGGASRGNGYNRGWDFQAAYAVTNNLAITSSYFTRREQDFVGAEVNYKRELVDFGAGAFTPLNQKKTALVALYGGVGFGKFRLDDIGQDRMGNHYARFHQADIRKIYLQPSLNFRSAKYFSMILSCRASFVHYGNIGSSYTEQENRLYGFDQINNKSQNFIEPSLAFQWTIPDVPWLAIDMIGTVCSETSLYGSRLQSRGFLGSMGLSFDISKIGKRSNRK